MAICILPRMRTLITLLFSALAVTLLGPSASARDGRPHADTAQAELHINVVIVPVVLPPRHHERHARDDRDEAAVVYNLAPPAEYSVTEELQHMMVNVDGAGERAAEVRVTTVVAK